MDNRRESERHFTCYPVHYLSEASESGEAHIALVHDLSITGALLFTRKKLTVGDPVTLELDLTTDGKDIKTATGTVVRSERRGPDRSDVWAYDIGVRFTAAMPELEPAIKALEERVKWLRDPLPKKEGA